MAAYLALPNELKDLINLSQTDLSRLSRTSKSMRRALLPRLFKRISLSWEAFKRPPRISSILEFVLQSSDLAKLVQEISFEGNGYRERIRNPTLKSHPTQKNVPEYLLEAKPKADGAVSGSSLLLQKVLRSMKLPKEEWNQVLGGEDELDFIIATIMVHCPNLKILRLGAAFIHQNTLLSKVLLHYLGSKSVSKLERVYLGEDAEGFWRKCDSIELPLASCLSFFYLPSLETLSAPLSGHIGHSHFHSRPKEWPAANPPLCNVRTLDMHTTRAKPAGLAFILARTPNLARLRYDHWCYVGEKLDCTELRSVLESVSGTLTGLAILLTAYTNEAEEIDEIGAYTVEGQGLGSLVSLSHLTKLEISLPILLGWNGDSGLRLEDALPPSLQELCLRDDFIHYSGMIWDEERTVEEVRRWLENCAWKKRTPDLQRFGLRLYHSQIEQWSAGFRNALMSLCEREELGFWFEKRYQDYEWREIDGKRRYVSVDNPLRYPLRGTRLN